MIWALRKYCACRAHAHARAQDTLRKTRMRVDQPGEDTRRSQYPMGTEIALSEKNRTLREQSHSQRTIALSENNRSLRKQSRFQRTSTPTIAVAFEQQPPTNAAAGHARVCVCAHTHTHITNLQTRACARAPTQAHKLTNARVCARAYTSTHLLPRLPMRPSGRHIPKRYSSHFSLSDVMLRMRLLWAISSTYTYIHTYIHI
jgi:hypothetical protein